jgi:hypothetical protein
MDNCSRRAHRLMTLGVATSITPCAPCRIKQPVRVLAWISLGWKLPGLVDHFWVEINSARAARSDVLHPDLRPPLPISHENRVNAVEIRHRRSSCK